MRGCQTCTHSIPIFISSDIYMDGYSQTCRDCKTGRKDGYEPIYGEEPKKYIIELSENDYMALKEDGVQNHLALADSIIAHSVPYEDRPKGEWVGDTDYESCQGHYESYKCSNCGYGLHWRDYYANKYNYCPNCGAEMGGKEE